MTLNKIFCCYLSITVSIKPSFVGYINENKKIYVVESEQNLIFIFTSNHGFSKLEYEK